MQVRSRMAAWMLMATTIGPAGFAAPACLAGGPTPVKQSVKLNIHLNGISSNSGAEIAIQPGHPATRFRPVSYPVRLEGGFVRDILPIDVETLSADRDCAFAIIIKEPGQADQVFRRSLQIVPTDEGAASKPQTLQCFLSSRSAVAKMAPPASTPVASKPAGDQPRKR